MELALTILLTVVLGVLGFPVIVGYFADLLAHRGKQPRQGSQKQGG